MNIEGDQSEYSYEIAHIGSYLLGDVIRTPEMGNSGNTMSDFADSLDRRTTLKLLGATSLVSSLGVSSASASDDDLSGSESFDLLEATITDIHAAFDAKMTTAMELTEQYIERIEAYDPQINLIITLNPNAVERAKDLDTEWKQSGPIGPLHGIPIFLKDNVDTADIPTTGGSVLFEDTIPPDDAYIVQQLREAGGIILAKVNMGEFASGSLSSLGGQTYNPYDLERNPGGSSAGTGAGIAANLATIGIGTDTGGSVRIPAGFNSLVGIRPTTGLVSRDGIIPLSETLDTAGPMTRTVADAAVMLDVIVGYDPADAKSAKSIGNVPEEGYVSYLNLDGLDGTRIGVLRQYIEDDTDDEGDEAGEPEVVAELIESSLADLETAGATLVDPVEIPDLEELTNEGYITGFEFERDLNQYIDELGDAAPVASQQEILESGTIEGAILGRFEDSRDIDVDTLDENTGYLRGLQAQRELREHLFVAMADENLDAFVYPTASRTPSRINEDRPSGINTNLSPVTAFPSLTVPAGFTDETCLPVGLEFLARPFEEPLLIELSYSYEQATLHRQPPEQFGPISNS